MNKAVEKTIQDGDVLVRERGALRRLTLNRPKALNALTLDMAATMAACLRAWADDEAVGAVLIDGAGERGLCAGGDLRALYDAAKAKDSLPAKFWATEYHLDVSDRALPQARGGDHGRRGHGRRRRHLGARGASRGDRTLLDRHAGSQHRIFPRCRRLVLAGAVARPYGHASGADREPHRRGRRDLLRAGRYSCSGSKSCRSSVAAGRLPFGAGCARGAERSVRPARPRQIAHGAAMDRRLLWRGECRGDCRPAARKQERTMRARRSQPWKRCRRPRSRSHCETSARRYHSRKWRKASSRTTGSRWRALPSMISSRAFARPSSIKTAIRSGVRQELEDVTQDIVDRHFRSVGALELNFTD